MKNQKKRKICFLITNRIHYARQKRLLDILNKDPRFDLQLILGGSVVVPKYGDKVFKEITNNGYNISDTLNTIVEGGNNIAMAKTTGISLIEFASAIDRLNPDIVILRGDRFEVLAGAIAAAYLNKTIAHIEGGDVSGTIDESVRHAITKLAHIHLTTNEDSYNRVLRMGENPKNVFNVGSLDVEHISSTNKKLSQKVIDNTASGAYLDITKPFITVMQHPVTTETNNGENILETIEAVNNLGIQVLWFWPNADAGTDSISKSIRMFREHKDPKNITFIKELLPEDFYAVLRKTSCLVGNSSCGIKESSYIGVPVVNIGTRQNGRVKAKNVLDVRYDRKEIKNAIKSQMKNGFYEPSNLYYKPNTSKMVVKILGEIEPETQKAFFDL
ncbi:MAG: UDP-N-acetylglucosamine 2-epimerase [Candidatus Paceibacterota bacterium]